MAEVQKKTIPPAAPQIQYVLTLTEEEAKVITFITGRIGGDPSGPRGTIAAIRKALIAAGAPTSDAAYQTEDWARSIYFKIG